MKNNEILVISIEQELVH